MLTTFASISPHLKFKTKKITIENLAFKFHCRGTFLILLVCSILVTSRQYIGEHIRCMTGGSPTIPEHVINTFCFFTTTFTVVRHLNESKLQSGEIPHPGIGPMIKNEVIKHHAYYQWVPFVLFLQALMFYFPHVLWQSWEGGKIKTLVDGLQMISLSKHLNQNDDLQLNNTTIPSRSTTDMKVAQIRIAFRQHIEVNNCWALKYVFAEFLNFLNLLFQIYFTNRFLGGQFLNLGIDFLQEDFKGKMDALDIVFPKVTKCHFYKYGASGSIQKHDALCIMALNVINEKIFTFLWFWYIIVGFVSVLALLWRLLTLCLHSKSARFNGIIFSSVCPGRLNPWDMLTVTNHFHFSDWLFLYYLAKNMEPFLFREMLIQIAHELRNETDTINNSVDESNESSDREDDVQDETEQNRRNYDMVELKF